MKVKVISGGQTGVDQIALWIAKALGLETGGYAPEKFMTEIGPAPNLATEYGLIDSGLDYVGRTEKNVQESDITLWYGNPDSAGGIATYRACLAYHKPFVIISVPGGCDEALHLIRDNKFRYINFAGHRHSKLNVEHGRDAMMKIALILNSVKELPDVQD